MNRLKPLVFALCLLPLLWLGIRGFYIDGLGVNPVETLNRFLGDWALRLLLLALAVTPIRRLTGWAGVMRLRRMLGLYAFFYAFLHVGSYLGVDLFFDWAAFVKDLYKRTYITLGMACFTILAVLAATSTDGMIRRLGGKSWRRLHQWVYLAGPLAVGHYWLMVKADLTQPMVHGLILAILLGLRLMWHIRRSRGVVTA